MITGAHAILFSPAAEQVRAFCRDVLDLPSADAGGGWLIFALPPAGLAVQPSGDEGPRCELYLMCYDLAVTRADLRARGAQVTREVSDQRWGVVPAIARPDGSELGIYE